MWGELKPEGERDCSKLPGPFLGSPVNEVEQSAEQQYGYDE